MVDVDELEYPPEATIGDQWARGLYPERRRLAASPFCSPADLRRRIADRAYRLFLERGRAPGRDVEDWLRAESLVLCELSGDGEDGAETT